MKGSTDGDPFLTLGWRQIPGPVVEAVRAGCRSGALLRAVYREVAKEVGKNLKDCVRRIGGPDDKVPPQPTLGVCREGG